MIGWERKIWKEYDESAIFIYENKLNGSTLLVYNEMNGKRYGKLLDFQKFSSRPSEQDCEEFEAKIVANVI